MKLTFPPEVEAVRAEFSAWLDEHLPAAGRHRSHGRTRRPTSRRGPRAFQAAMFDAGWLLPGPAARVRRAQRSPARAVRHPGRDDPPPRVPELQPAGPRDHRTVDPDVRHAGPEAAVGGADPARRDHRRARDERAERRQRPRRSAHTSRARRRRVRRQRSEGVDVGRARRRRHPRLRPHRSRRPEAQGSQRAAHPDRHRPA